MDSCIKCDDVKLPGKIFCRRQRLKILGCIWETNQSMKNLLHTTDPRITVKNTRGHVNQYISLPVPPWRSQSSCKHTDIKASVTQGSGETKVTSHPGLTQTEQAPRTRDFSRKNWKLFGKASWVGEPSGEVPVTSSTSAPRRELVVRSVYLDGLWNKDFLDPYIQLFLFLFSEFRVFFGKKIHSP